MRHLSSAAAQSGSAVKLPWWKVLSWQVYEAGDSSWSLIIYSTYFGIFVQDVLHGSAVDFGKAASLGALFIALLSPLLGAAVDISGRRQPYLRFFALATVICTVFIGFSRTYLAALTFFVLAQLFINGGFAFFTAMVPAVSTERTVSRVISGAVGISYFWNIVAIVGFGILFPDGKDSYKVFAPQGLIYLVLALPCLFLAPDFIKQSRKALDIGGAYRRVATTFKSARQHSALFRFLIGDFLYENAVASVIALMGIYSRNVIGFSAGELKLLFGPALLVAGSAALVFGWLINKYGARRMLIIDLIIWLILFVLIMVISNKWVFLAVAAPLAGIGLAGVWSTSRVMLTALTPVEESGEIWGLYNLSGRSASFVGDAAWTTVLAIVGETAFGYKFALGTLALFIVAGLFLVLSLPDARPSAANMMRHA